MAFERLRDKFDVTLICERPKIGPHAAAMQEALARILGTDPGRISVVEVEGLIDPVLAAFIERSIADGERSGVVAVVLQMDSSGSVLGDDALRALATRIHDAKVPVVVWVGPSGSSALGGAAQLAGVSDRIGLAPGSRLGKTGDLVVPRSMLLPAFRAALPRLEDGTVGEKQARALKIVPLRRAAIIGEFVIDLDGVQTETPAVALTNAAPSSASSGNASEKQSGNAAAPAQEEVVADQ